MGIQLGSRHKRRATGGKRSVYRKRRKFLLGRQAAKTKLSEENRVHKIRVRGGNFKLRALRLNSGIFSWGSEGLSRKTRIIEVVYNGANNEFVRTNTLVKGEIVLIDATPFRMWYESYYGAGLGRKLPAPVKKATKKVKKATSAKPKKAAGEGKPEEKAQGEKKEDKPAAKAGKKAAAKPAAKEGAKAGKKVAAKPAAKAAKAGKAAKPAAKAGKKAAAKPAAKEGAKAEGEKVEKKEGEAEPAAKAAAKAGAKVAAKPAAKAAKAAKAGAKVAAKSAGKSAAKSTGKAGAKGKKIATKKKPIIKPVVKSARVLRKYKARAQKRAVEPILEEHFGSGRVLACISSRPGQTGRVDGYILEGKELEFYIKKTQKKKSK